MEVNALHDKCGTPLEPVVREAGNLYCREIVKELLDKGALISIGSSYFGSLLKTLFTGHQFELLDRYARRQIVGSGRRGQGGKENVQRLV